MLPQILEEITDITSSYIYRFKDPNKISSFKQATPSPNKPVCQPNFRERFSELKQRFKKTISFCKQMGCKKDYFKFNALNGMLVSSMAIMVFATHTLSHNDLKSCLLVIKNNGICFNALADKTLEKEIKKLRLSSSTKYQVQESIEAASHKTGLPTKLIFLLIKQESAFKQYAISPVGASGYTQLMPDTARTFCKIKGNQIFEANLNIMCGSKYLRRLLKDFNGDLELALAAYNSGPNRIKRLVGRKNSSFSSIRSRVPKETKNYVARINSSFTKAV